MDIRIAEAVNVLTFEPRDPAGNVVVPRLQRMILRRSGESFEMGLAVSGLPSIDFAFSPLGASHLVDWLNTADPAPDRTYSFFWHRAGIRASETLTNQPADLTALDFRLDADPGTTSVDVIHWTKGWEGTSRWASATSSRCRRRSPGSAS